LWISVVFVSEDHLVVQVREVVVGVAGRADRSENLAWCHDVADLYVPCVKVCIPMYGAICVSNIYDVSVTSAVEAVRPTDLSWLNRHDGGPKGSRNVNTNVKPAGAGSHKIPRVWITAVARHVVKRPARSVVDRKHIDISHCIFSIVNLPRVTLT